MVRLERGPEMAATLTNGTAVKVYFGDAITGGHEHYVGVVEGFQPGHIGLYEIRWAETIPGYMRRGSIDLIEQNRVSGF